MKAVPVFFVCVACMTCMTNTFSESDGVISQRIARINRHVTFIHNVHKKSNDQLKSALTISKASLCQLDQINYNHELVRLCVKKITLTGSMEPIFNSWEVFLSTFKEIDQPLFLQEFSVLMFNLYKNLICTLSKPESKVTPAEIFVFSSRIMTLPIDDLLDALDSCYHQFLLILQDYGMTSETNPREWLKQYWWVIPVSIASVIVSMLKHLLVPSFERPSLANQETLLHDKVRG